MAPPTSRTSMSAWSYRHWCTHAEILNNARHRCTTEEQLNILDWIGLQLLELYGTDAPVTFDPDWFAHKAALGWYRQHPHSLIDPQGEPHELRQSDHRDRQPDPRS